MSFTSATRQPIMSLLRTAAALVAAAIATGCGTDLFYSASDPIVGHWRAAPTALQPTGQLLRTLDLSTDGRYVHTTTLRGVYPQLSADAIGSISRSYGRYVYANDELRTTQDSARTWDYMSGEYFYAGPRGIAIEGPPTVPTVELTPDRLVLRYMVNPGAGYVPVTDEYFRDR